jgi:hypothetical protein
MEGGSSGRPSALSQLLALVRGEVAGLQAAWAAADVHEVAGHEYECYLLTLSALAHIQATLSPGRYWSLHAEGRPPNGTEECLAAAAGICGHHAQAMLDVMRELGCEARPVGFYFRGAFGPASHAAVEVAWGGAWHYVDVTHGAVFRRPGARSLDLLSIRQILDSPEPRRLAILNASRPEFQLTSDYIGDPLDYVESDPCVVIDGSGDVRVPASHDQSRIVYQLEGFPNYVGAVARFGGGVGSLCLRLPVPEAVERLDLTVQGTACVEGRLRVRSDLGIWEAAVDPAVSRLSIPARADGGDLELSMVAPAGAVCYVLFEEIAAVVSGGSGAGSSAEGDGQGRRGGVLSAEVAPAQ